MQIMMTLSIQNGVRGNYDWRAASERALHKKARHVQNGLVLDTACSGRGWNRGKKLGAVVPTMESVAIVD
jgi:hypothetical protein